MARFVALLRGINVGGKHKLPMADLRAHFVEAGASTVETYIQSGNVAFEAGARAGKQIAATVSATLEAERGFPVPIVLRTAAAWRSMVAANPFPDEAASDPKRVHVMLLDRAPTKASRARLRPDCRLGERWVMGKDVLYADYPSGSGRSKLSASYVDRVLDCTATARNWRTVLALLERVE